MLNMYRRASLALVIACFVATTARGVPFPADKVVPLPVPPNPAYTNTDSGTVILGSYPDSYASMVENELRFDHWKEWQIVYTITPIVPQDWLADLHVDYALRVNPGQQPPLFEHLQLQVGQDLYTAFWQTYYGGSGSPAPLQWTVVGYPSSVQPLMVNPQTADLVIDTLPFDWNPQWVSLEFGGANVQVEYEFYDWCIPEPAGVVTLAAGAVLCGLRRR